MDLYALPIQDSVQIRSICLQRNCRWSYTMHGGSRVKLWHQHFLTMKDYMRTRQLILSDIEASTFSAVVPSAQARTEVFMNVPPPAVRYEAVPAPRAGYYYHPNRWVERDGRWLNERSRWDRSRPLGDRDHDGIPNARDRDRDGDGVPNRLDRKPDNPRQR